MNSYWNPEQPPPLIAILKKDPLSFLDNKTPQSFPITLERETFKVVCDSYNVNIGHDDVQSISMELRRVY